MFIFRDIFKLSKENIKEIEKYLGLNIIDNKVMDIINEHLSEFNIELKYNNDWHLYFIDTIKLAIVVRFFEVLEEKNEIKNFDECFDKYLNNQDKINKLLTLEKLGNIKDIKELKNILKSEFSECIN